MHDQQSRSHVRWDSKYHIEIVPRYRKKLLFGRLWMRIGLKSWESCQRKGIGVASKRQLLITHH
jgi:putative transposase